MLEEDFRYDVILWCDSPLLIHLQASTSLVRTSFIILLCETTNAEHVLKHKIMLACSCASLTALAMPTFYEVVSQLYIVNCGQHYSV